MSSIQIQQKERNTNSIGNSSTMETRTPPMNCQICGKKLSSEAILKRHCKEIHKMTPDMKPIVLKTFPCTDPLCSSNPFIRSSHLLQHMRRIHGVTPQMGASQVSTRDAQRRQPVPRSSLIRSGSANEDCLVSSNFATLNGLEASAEPQVTNGIGNNDFNVTSKFLKRYK